MTIRPNILFLIITTLFACIAILLFHRIGTVMCPTFQGRETPARNRQQISPMSEQNDLVHSGYETKAINSGSKAHFSTHEIPADWPLASDFAREHAVLAEKAESICKADLKRTFPHKSFTLDSASVDQHRITVVLSDGNSSQKAIPYNRYHFVVDTQRWTILSESIEIVEDMVIVDTPSSK